MDSKKELPERWYDKQENVGSKSLGKTIFVKCWGEIKKDKDFVISIGFPT